MRAPVSTLFILSIVVLPLCCGQAPGNVPGRPLMHRQCTQSTAKCATEGCSDLLNLQLRRKKPPAKE